MYFSTSQKNNRTRTSLNASVNESSLKNQILKYSPKTKLYLLKFPALLFDFQQEREYFSPGKELSL